MEESVSLSVEKANKWYPGGVHAVVDMDLEVDRGEFMVFVGSSGCGKSTLLRMIAGLERVDGGTIRMGERVVNKVPPKERDIAMVFQNYALYPTMKVYDNMAFPLKMRRWKKVDIRARVTEVAASLGLTEYLDRYPGALSGGQRQRVALGRAMVRSPRLFLMDEPLSNLDAKLRVDMRREIVSLQRSLGTTTVYVTHDQTEAMTMADRIVVLKDGVIQQVDSPQELYDHPVNRFVAGFIGTPPMNFFQAGVERAQGGHVLVFGDCRIPTPAAGLEPYEGREITVGVRPEDIHGEEAFLALSTSGQLEAHVDLAEMMGAEIYLYITVNGQKLISRVPSRMAIRGGDTVRLAVDGNKVHLFDPETEQRI